MATQEHQPELVVGDDIDEGVEVVERGTIMAALDEVGKTTVSLSLYVEDVDAEFQQAGGSAAHRGVPQPSGHPWTRGPVERRRSARLAIPAHGRVGAVRSAVQCHGHCGRAARRSAGWSSHVSGPQLVATPRHGRERGRRFHDLSGLGAVAPRRRGLPTACDASGMVPLCQRRTSWRNHRERPSQSSRTGIISRPEVVHGPTEGPSRNGSTRRVARWKVESCRPGGVASTIHGSGVTCRCRPRDQHKS
jgi:hypothetical protein